MSSDNNDNASASSSSSSNNDSSSSEEDMGEQVRISLRLSTECANRALEVPRDPIAVPADIGRKGLSIVINHLLDRRLPNENDDDEDKDSDDEGDDDDVDRLPSINFDFMIGKNSKLLRTALEREARRTGLSLEEAIPITYFPAQRAPELKGESERLPDWISSLSFSSDLLCAGCYDGSMHVFQTKDNHNNSVLQNVAVQKKSHQGPIQCMSIMMTDDDGNNNSLWVATGSMDHTLMLHQVDRDTYKTKVAVKCIEGHAAAIGSVDFFPPSKTLASGDWDGALCIWNNNVVVGGDQDKVDDPTEQQQPSKKSKTGSNKAKETSDTATSSIRKQSPIISLQAHSSNISGLSWGNYEKKQAALSAAAAATTTTTIPETLITGSWDHSLKVWNIERQDCLLTLNGSRVISCLDTSYFSSGIVATGHPDCTVRLWDVRTENTKESALSAISDNTFRPSHKAWVSAVQWSRHNPYHLASTSHDGTIKLWDIRSSIPLHTVRAFEKTEKGLALAYGDAESGLVYAGGTDCIVKQYRSGEGGNENEQ